VPAMFNRTNDSRPKIDIITIIGSEIRKEARVKLRVFDTCGKAEISARVQWQITVCVLKVKR
jgi:hypothetical protein